MQIRSKQKNCRYYKLMVQYYRKSNREKKQSQKEGPITDQKYVFVSSNNYFVNCVCVCQLCLSVCLCLPWQHRLKIMDSVVRRPFIGQQAYSGRVQVSWLIKVWIMCIYVDRNILGVPKTQNKFLVKNVNFSSDIALAKLDFPLLLPLYIVIAFQQYNSNSFRSKSLCLILCIGIYWFKASFQPFSPYSYRS